jgi:predicted metalloprotease with PDZ domain
MASGASRIPYLFVGTLGFLAVLVLGSRVGKPRAAEPHLHAAAPRRDVLHPGPVKAAEALERGDAKGAARRTLPGTVGAGFSEEHGRVTVAWLVPEGPAAKAGVHVGDAVLAVDGMVVRNRQEAESRTRGAPGTPVRLEVRRDTGEAQQVQLTRAD